MSNIEEVINTVKILRSPEGCPWDREQTHKSIRKNMLEEAYEAVEAIDENNSEHLKEELSDVLLQVLLHSQISSDEGEFDIEDVAKTLNDKLIHRHPHVFSNTKVKNSSEVLKNWEELKLEEKRERKRTLDGLVSTMPALARALKISSKVVRQGFEWEREEDLFSCLESEVSEFRAAKTKEEKLEELGDILFTVVNIARWNNIDPEEALEFCNKKFIKRFNKLEELAQKPLKELTLDEYDKLWKKAKTLVL